jgi:DNA-binding XRE family transcriptional regulator
LDDFDCHGGAVTRATPVTIAREVAANPNATQKELAREIGVSRSTVDRVMRTP